MGKPIADVRYDGSCDV